MAQKQCPWCGYLGSRIPDSNVESAPVPEHDCVCRHVTASSRASALEHHGRYYDRDVRKWKCFGCGTARKTALDDARELDERTVTETELNGLRPAPRVSHGW